MGNKGTVIQSYCINFWTKLQNNKDDYCYCCSTRIIGIGNAVGSEGTIIGIGNTVGVE